MKRLNTPPQDLRDARLLLQELRTRAQSYVPDLHFADGGAGAALAAIVARHGQTVLQRLNQAPDKHKLAFLSALGVEPTPAQAARTPLVFQLNDKAESGSAPRGTAVAAPPPPGSSDQIVFETEDALGVTAGKLVQTVSIWPGRDAFIDHSASLAADSPFVLFERASLAQVEHVIYLAHSKLLALAGTTRLSLEWQMTQPSSVPLQIQWEYWDGKVWREFLELNPSCLAEGVALPDSTAGLSRSGRIELRADGATSQTTSINGEEAYWLRGRLIQALPPDRAEQLPEVDSIRLSSTVEQPLVGSLAIHAFSADLAQAHIRVRNEAGEPLSGASVALSFNTGGTDFQSLDESEDAGIFPLPPGRNASEVRALQVTFFGTQASSKLAEGVVPEGSDIQLSVILAIRALTPDKALGEGAPLDTSKPFYPFGQQPQPGAAFYLNCEEAFTKPGGVLRIYLPLTSAPGQEVDTNTSDRSPLARQISWEYWNGRAWALLLPVPGSSALGDLSTSEVLQFMIPSDFESTRVNEQEGRWIRARLVSGGFGYFQTLTWQAGSGSNATNHITYVVHQPPVAADVRLGYSWQYGPFHLDRVLTLNDFNYEDHTDDACWPGSSFAPFVRVKDETAALYLGFDRAPPTDKLGIFFDVVEHPDADPPPAQLWEFWDGYDWRALSVDDGTEHLHYPAIASFIAQADSAPLARFGKPLHWVRLRSKEDVPPAEVSVAGIFPNAVWASQQRTLRDLALGQGTGAPSQGFNVPQIPVLPGELLEVRELSGARANVEWRLLALELFGGDIATVRELEELLAEEGPQQDISRSILRLRRDRLKRVAEAWVLWSPIDSFNEAGPLDRCYSLDRARGVLRFGDGEHGRVLPAGAALNARVLRTGGGKAGNVPAGALSQLQSGVPGVSAVFNPRAAEGGANGEAPEALVRRAPQTVRHRGRAVSVSDYATLARESSSAVAYARAIPMLNPAGRVLPGWVTVIIIPHGLEARPEPSVGLRQRVAKYLRERAPADLVSSGRINVVGPVYAAIDVSATIAPLRAAEAGIVERAARNALAAFFHPLYGGPLREGWDLGRAVFLSDVAAVLERVPGLDYTEELLLLADGEPQQSEVKVSADRIAVGGSFRLKVKV